MNPILGEIALVPFAYAPRGWALCDGQLLPINQYMQLFSLIGTRYGGDGRTTFALPDLRGRIPVGDGNGLLQGDKLGAETHTLTELQMGAHIHSTNNLTVKASGEPGDSASPNLSLPAIGFAGDIFGDGFVVVSYTGNYPDTTLAYNTVQATMQPTTGGGQSHDNMQPFLVMNYIICLWGTSPS